MLRTSAAVGQYSALLCLSSGRGQWRVPMVDAKRGFFGKTRAVSTPFGSFDEDNSFRGPEAFVGTYLAVRFLADELLPLAGWSSHLRSSRQQFAIATPPPLPSPLASPVAAVSPRASPRRLMSDADVIYCPGSGARPEPLAHGGSAAAAMDTQPPVVQPLGGVGSAGRPALSFADSQDSLADITSSSALSRSVAVAPLPTYIKSQQKSRAPPPMRSRTRWSLPRAIGADARMTEMMPAPTFSALAAVSAVSVFAAQGKGATHDLYGRRSKRLPTPGCGSPS